MSGKRKTPRGAVTFQTVAATACELPEVEISTSYGTPALKVRGKLMARLHQDGEAVVLRSDFLDRQILMQADPETFFITDHYRDYPLVLMRLAKVARAALPELMERAWRQVAPRTLVDKFDAARN
jgi:hypothetical protein